jgi:hypothetical protein
MGGLHGMRVIPKWRGTIIVIVGLLAYIAIFYGSENRNSSATKAWLYISFAICFFGGVLAFVDSLIGFMRAKRQRDEKE